jgi:ADP-heptose:LPS heptosyltransferase
MKRWPKSLPDYRWPPHLMSVWVMPLRWILASIFHVSYALGLLASLMPGGRVRVLVIRTDGLGDGLLFEPALENLARVLSPRVIHLWGPKLTRDLFRHCPTIARMMVIPRGFKSGNLRYFLSPILRARLGFALGRWTFDKVIYPVESPEPLGNWLFASARAVERWLNSGDTANQFDWQQARIHEVATKIIETRPGNAHELLRNEYLTEQWSGERTLRQPKVHLADGMKARAEAQVDLWRAAAKKRGGEEVIGIVPAASMPIKAYPDARWAAALKRLWEQQRAMPVLLGGPSDGASLDALASALVAAEVPHQRLVAPLDILEMAAIVAELDGVLSVDTGLAHLSVAQGVPTVVLVTGGNPGRFFPWPNARSHVVLNVPMSCSGCNDRCTLSEAECITHIPSDDIVAAYARLKGRRVSLDVMIAPQQKPKKPLQQAG